MARPDVPGCANAAATAVGYMYGKATGDTRCFVLANSEAAPDVYNPQDLAAGMSLSFNGGDSCIGFNQDGSVTKSTYKLTVNLVCSNVQGGPPQVEVYETEACTFNVDFPTHVGCPVPCIADPAQHGSSRICSGQGVCRYDTVNNAAKCLCNHGQSGALCATNASASPLDVDGNAGSVAAAFFLSFFITLIVLAVVYFGVPRWRGSRAGGSAQHEGFAALGDEPDQTLFTGQAGNDYRPPL